MPDPINLQVNVLQSQEVPRQTQQVRDVSQHQQIGQEMDRAKEAAEEPEQVQTSPESHESKLSGEGSGRGRAFLRQRKKKEQGGEEPEEERPTEPKKGEKVDFVR